MPQQQQRSLLESLLTAGGLLPYQVTPPHDWQEAAQQAQRAKPLLDLILGQAPEPPPQDADFGQKLAYILGTPGVLPAGMTAFHGTPHTFAPVPENPLGAFDLSKIGTGEGAQAYGHGIYLAENPKVARSYQTQLAPVSNEDLRSISIALPKRFQGSLDAARTIIDRITTAVSKGDIQRPQDYVNEYSLGELEPAHAAAAKILAGKGKVYHVDLPDEHIAKMLDWDKPVTGPVSDRLADLRGAQKYGYSLAEWHSLPDNKRAALSASAGAEPLPSGGAIYDMLTKELGSPQGASAYLSARGIPGIKYLDAGSRAAGEGSRNFVLFDPSIAKITKAE